MKFIWLLFSLSFLQDQIPLKPKEEFEIKLAFEFKQRSANDPYKVEMSETRKEYERRVHTGPLPYLYMNLNLLKINPGETRIRIINNNDQHIVSKKLEKSTTVKLDLGFTDDIKDRITAYEYTAYILSQDKKPLSKIVIQFEEDGTYRVNGERRGKL